MSQAVIAKKEYAYDPRVSLCIVICLSALAVIFTDVLWLAGLFMLSLLAATIFRGRLDIAIAQLRWLIPMFFMLCIVQSIFNSSDNILLHIGSVKILTGEGIAAAALFTFRIIIVVLSASILFKESSRRIIQALSQMHCPYEIAFMTSVAVRFLSVIREEFKNSLYAVQMRGADLKKIPLKQRAKVYSFILLPVMSSTLFRAKQLSLSLELRGFRRSRERTSYFYLTMQKKDWLIIILSLICTLTLAILYFLV